MCFGCWEEYGRSKIMNEKVKAAMALVHRVYNLNCAGLHVQLDDWNIEDRFFGAESREETIAWQNHRGISDEAKIAELECFDAMASMSIEERNSVLYFDYTKEAE